MMVWENGGIYTYEKEQQKYRNRWPTNIQAEIPLQCKITIKVVRAGFNPNIYIGHKGCYNSKTIIDGDLNHNTTSEHYIHSMFNVLSLEIVYIIAHKGLLLITNKHCQYQYQVYSPCMFYKHGIYCGREVQNTKHTRILN